MPIKRFARDTILRSLDRLWQLRTGSRHPRIIYYHSVNDNNPRSHSVITFRSQMEWLATNGWRTRTISSLDNEPAREGDVFITFDDGYHDNICTALPILIEYHFVAAFYIATGYTSQDDDFRVPSNQGNRLYPNLAMMNASDIVELRRYGMEIGTHGVSHQMFTRLPKEAQHHELWESKQLLEHLIGIPVTSFAFPNGQRGAVSRTTVQAARSLGITQICSTLWGPLLTTQDAAFLPRCEMSRSDTLHEFVAKMCGFREYRYLLDRAIDKSRAWD